MPSLTKTNMTTRDEVMRLLDYDPETGVFKWKVRRSGTAKAGAVAGCVRNDGYRVIGICGRNHLAHRIVWLITKGEWPDSDLDHKNLHRDDNRINNQRNNKLGVKGVRLVPRLKSRPYEANIQVGGLLRHIGYFATAEEAGTAYAAESEKHYGGFARCQL